MTDSTRGPASARRAPALALAAGLAAAAQLVACGGAGPTAPGPFRANGFPAGEAIVFGVASDARTGGRLVNLPVILTPDDGLPLEQELASPVQAEARTNLRGEFTFSGLGPGPFVLFVRFDANHLGYGEVVGRLSAGREPLEVLIAPAAVALTFADPTDGDIVSAADTARLAFTDVVLESLLTVTSETRPVFARVRAYANEGGGRGDSSSPPRPRLFEAQLEDEDLRIGQATVPLEVGGLGAPLRLEPYLGLHVAYRDPRGGPAGVHEIPGRAISVVTR